MTVAVKGESSEPCVPVRIVKIFTAGAFSLRVASSELYSGV